MVGCQQRPAAPERRPSRLPLLLLSLAVPDGTTAPEGAASCWQWCEGSPEACSAPVPFASKANATCDEPAASCAVFAGSGADPTAQGGLCWAGNCSALAAARQLNTPGFRCTLCSEANCNAARLPAPSAASPTVPGTVPEGGTCRADADCQIGECSRQTCVNKLPLTIVAVAVVFVLLVVGPTVWKCYKSSLDLRGGNARRRRPGGGDDAERGMELSTFSSDNGSEYIPPALADLLVPAHEEVPWRSTALVR